MKIAVASEGKMVTGHFGHCQNFNIFDEEKGKIINVELIKFLRPERKFSGLDELKRAIIKNGHEAKEYFAKNGL